ncbi:hypothetical protein J2W55_003253 [Mucilaginibacter pocheonensis]|uniref:Uncharacterized protein n=1 Tax=Mucilaginibacter pocheonensis TaxID=398050 RepID=A0ABU1TDZ8_9SPHI|nr:hypothetical protein [Mucilaginibacter pocheonensis]
MFLKKDLCIHRGFFVFKFLIIYNSATLAVQMPIKL